MLHLRGFAGCANLAEALEARFWKSAESPKGKHSKNNLPAKPETAKAVVQTAICKQFVWQEIENLPDYETNCPLLLGNATSARASPTLQTQTCEPEP